MLFVTNQHIPLIRGYSKRIPQSMSVSWYDFLLDHSFCCSSWKWCTPRLWRLSTRIKSVVELPSSRSSEIISSSPLPSTKWIATLRWLNLFLQSVLTAAQSSPWVLRIPLINHYFFSQNGKLISLRHCHTCSDMCNMKTINALVNMSTSGLVAWLIKSQGNKEKIAGTISSWETQFMEWADRDFSTWN